MSAKFLIDGPARLAGSVTVSGSKNAVLPILAATALVRDEVRLENVPRIRDVEAMLEILEGIGASYRFEGSTVTIDCTGITSFTPDKHLVKHLRASILLLGPLLARFGEAKMAYPGGCVIGKRNMTTHERALMDLGAELLEDESALWMRTTGLRGSVIRLTEVSVTGTENAVMAAVTASGTTQIRLAAAEPHVADLCRFLVACGARIEGIGTHVLTIEGVKTLHGATHAVTPDYLEAGTWAIAGALTQSAIEVRNCVPDQLDALWNKLREVGIRFEIDGDTLRLKPPFTFETLKAPKLDTGIFPMFPTDLQAPFAVLLTQLPGVSKIFETLFEGRLTYLFELEKMGAHVEVMNPHQALVIGPARLKATTVTSWDLRAGAAMVLAALVAEGTTEVTNIVYIDRGYDDFEGKLRVLGANIRRVEE